MMTSIRFQEAGGSEELSDCDIEPQISKFVRRDGPTGRNSTDAESELVPNNIAALLQSVGSSSVQEIDRLTAELQVFRDLLLSEGARVQRGIIEYARLSRSVMHTTMIVKESLAEVQQ
jgi:hypothetical protein